MGAKAVPLLDGRIKDTTALGTNVLCQLDLAYLVDDISNTNQTRKNTLIQDLCVLKPIFSTSIGTNPVKPGEIFQYTIGANCRLSRLKAPEFSFYLPKELTYIGNATGNFYDYFGTQEAFAVPEPSILANANDAQDTLVTFSFTGANDRDFEQKSRLKITFDTEVLATAKGEFSSHFLLDSISAEDGESAKSNIYKNAILFFLSISSNKEVKGFHN